MLYKVTKRADDFAGIVATLFTGAGSVSAVVGGEWGHFHRTGFMTGEFVVEPAANVSGKAGYDFQPVRPSGPKDYDFIHVLRGKPWRLWHNCFGSLEGLWGKN